MNSLQGSLPSELGFLQDVVRFNFFENSLQGIIPSELGKLASLEQFAVGHNDLQGVIPSEIGKLLVLRWLLLSIFLDGNSLQGDIPSEFGQLAKVTWTDVGYNSLHGSLPSELGRMTSTQKLYVTNNSLTGIIPTQLGRLVSLKQLWFGMNSLAGSLPSELSNLAKVLDLYGFSNFVDGDIPSELGRSDMAIRSFKFYENALQGGIPTEFGQLVLRRDLTVSDNSLVGTLPTELGKMVRVNVLDVCHNSLYGVIPSEISSFKKLQVLALHENLFQGSIPSELGKIRFAGFYGVLALANNCLEGSVPANFPPPRCNILFLHHNMLSGKLQFRKDAENGFRALTLHKNQLGGSVPVLTFGLVGDWSFSKVPFTLHGNHLSCMLPNHEFKLEGDVAKGNARRNETRLNKSSSLLGNFFLGPLPSWIPVAEQDPILYQQPRTMTFQSTWLAAGLLLFGCSAWWIMGARELLLVCHVAYRQARHSEVPCTHYSTLVVCIARGTLVCLVVMFPPLCLGNRFFECSQPPPNYSDLQDTVAERIVGGCFVLQYGLASVTLISVGAQVRPQKARPFHVPSILRRLLYSLGWAAIILLFALPSMVYTLTKSLPKENLLADSLGTTAFFAIHYSSIATGTLLMSLVLPGIAKKYMRASGISAANLKLWCFFFGFWGLPVIMVVVVHENCFGFWRAFWSICNVEHPEHHRFDSTFPHADQSERLVISTTELCQRAYISEVARNHKCGRTLVALLAPILYQKTFIEMCIVPCTFLWLWYVCKYAAHRRLKLLGQKISNKLTIKLQRSNQFAQLSLWLHLSVTWGPMIPALAPLVLLAMSTNLVTYHIGIYKFQAAPVEKDIDVAVPSCFSALLKLLAIGYTMTLAISFHMRVSGIGLLCCVPITVVLVLLSWRLKHGRRKAPAWPEALPGASMITDEWKCEEETEMPRWGLRDLELPSFF